MTSKESANRATAVKNPTGHSFTTLTAEISPRRGALIVSLAMLPMLACAWFFGLREETDVAMADIDRPVDKMRVVSTLSADRTTFPNSNSRLSEQPRALLPFGSQIPPLIAPGWFNGAPDAGDLEGKVLVIDVWDGLCPLCSEAAPILLEAYAKYHDRGVVFIGLTTANEDEARQYVDHWHLPWPNGYHAIATIDTLKADVPTLLVVDPRGRLLWDDGQARWRHDIVMLGEQLERAIEIALAPDRTAASHFEKLGALLP